jgi:hypothetical protein
MEQHATHSGKGLLSTGTCRGFFLFLTVRDKVPLSVEDNGILLERRFLELVPGAVYIGRNDSVSYLNSQEVIVLCLPLSTRCA